MNARQQRQASKAKKIKTTPIPKLQKEDKKPQLKRLSGIMKGIVVYKTETAELSRLMEKYPHLGSPIAMGAYA